MVIKQLKSHFIWIQGEDVLYMHKKLKVYEHQTLIKHFNNVNSEAKKLLTTTRDCSKWINLIDASKVVLFYVMWNLSADIQTINNA